MKEYMDGVLPEEENTGAAMEDMNMEGAADAASSSEDWNDGGDGEGEGWPPGGKDIWPPPVGDGDDTQQVTDPELPGDGDEMPPDTEGESTAEDTALDPGSDEAATGPDSGEEAPGPDASDMGAGEEEPKKPARKRETSSTARKRAAPKKTAAKEEAPPELEPQGEAEEAVEQTERSMAEKRRQATLQRQQRRRERERTAILDVDGTSRVEDSDGFDERAAAVYQAKNTRTICCGNITGVKFSRGTGHYVEAEYNGFRVLIPFVEMDVVLERQPSDNDNDFENKTITAIRNMVGAEIEFMILDIDENEQIAIASRRVATEQRRKTVLNGTSRDGQYIIYPSRQVVARVLDVHPFYAWVDVAGWRTRLSASELRAEYVEDMTTELANGQRVTVTIKELERDRHGNVIDMRVSMRDDEKEKRELEKAMAGINIGDIIRCEVVGRSSKVIRLKTHNGARAFCYIAMGLHGRYIPKLNESVTIKVIRKTENPRTGNPVIQGNILRRSVKPGLL